MSGPDLPPLRDVITEYGLGANKSLGQHFLLDLNLTRKIARLAGVNSDDKVIEIGPGPGGLTRALLETGADVHAIERDKRCLPLLADLSTAYDGRLNIISDDALSFDEKSITTAPVKIISNLPYNISTELLIKWLKMNQMSETPFWTKMALMFQREVADRILAEPGGKTFGRLSVIAQSTSIVKRGFDLPARAFTPPPKVDSSVVVFEAAPRIDHLPPLETITRAAFSQRRKMLRRSLHAVFGASTETVLSAHAIKPTDRAEDISIADYNALAIALATGRP